MRTAWKKSKEKGSSKSRSSSPEGRPGSFSDPRRPGRDKSLRDGPDRTELPPPVSPRGSSILASEAGVLILFSQNQISGCSPALGSQVLKGVALFVVVATSWVKELIDV